MQAVRQLRNEARRDETTPLAWLRQTDDPTVKTVFFEDSAALIGLLLAFAGVGLHQLTGSAFWDGLASVLIAVLLTAVAYILGGTNKGLLIGRQADGRTVYALRDALADRPEVEQVVDLLTMMIGTDQILLCARLDFDDALDAASLERACAAIDADLRDRFPDIAEIFVEPVPAHGQGDPRAGAGAVRARRAPTACGRGSAPRSEGPPECQESHLPATSLHEGGFPATAHAARRAAQALRPPADGPSGRSGGAAPCGRSGTRPPRRPRRGPRRSPRRSATARAPCPRPRTPRGRWS